MTAPLAPRSLDPAIDPSGPRRRRRPRRRRTFAAVAAIAVSLLGATAALAQDEALDGKLRTGNAITIGADETVAGDLYAAGGTVIVDGTVEGDLVAAGGDVRVNGTVVGDLIAAGGSVTVNGTVAGDVRAAGGQIAVSGTVGEDLLVTAGQATVTAAGSVGEDLIVSVGQLTLAGSVAGSTVGTAGSYDRSGTVDGDDDLVVGEAAEDGEVERETASERVLEAVRHWVVVTLLGGLALWLLPGWTRGVADVLRRRPLASLGVGALAAIGWIGGVIVLILVMILAAIVLGLLTLGELAGLIAFAGVVGILISTFALVVIVGYLADALVGLALAGLVRTATASRWTEFALLAAGAAVVVVLTSLPIVGGWLKLLVALLGLGAIVLAAWTGWRSRRVSAGAVTAPTGVAQPDPSRPAPRARRQVRSP